MWRHKIHELIQVQNADLFQGVQDQSGEFKSKVLAKKY